MSILDRIRRIAKANISRLLDMAEPAEQELQAKIKELEEAILEGRESAATYGATFRRLETELDQLKQNQTECTKQAETALKAGNEKAARKALSEKVKFAERMAQMQPGIERGRKTYEMLRDNIIKLQEQLKAARLKLADLEARKRTAEAQLAFDKHLDRATSLNPEGVAFDRLEEQVLQNEAKVQIHQELRGDSLTEVELAQRSRELQVEAELEEMKERLEQD
ncbi:MAG: PspA/IM30 family protein [Sedimentisphaerales bacterium]|nr:PspA/IM30 family protein [Sedimentisphaerales bacterium]